MQIRRIQTTKTVNVAVCVPMPLPDKFRASEHFVTCNESSVSCGNNGPGLMRINLDMSQPQHLFCNGGLIMANSPAMQILAALISNASAIDHHNHHLISPLIHAAENNFYDFYTTHQISGRRFKFIYICKTCGITYLTR